MSLTWINRMELEYPSLPRIVHDVRGQFEAFAREWGLVSDDVETVKVALSEATTNAVCHGSPRGAQDRVIVRWMVDDDCLVIEVEDQGGGFKPREIALPDDEEWKPSGRGLFLMQALMDDVRWEATPLGTRVRLVKRLARIARPVGKHGVGAPDIALESSSSFAPMQPAAYHERA